jgi:hypothetical protein
MTSFATVLESEIPGKLTTFDRLIFHGHVTKLFGKNAFCRFLAEQGVELRHLDDYFQSVTKQVREHVFQLAKKDQRPVIYQAAPQTSAKGCGKDQLAREIAARDGITEGLICVLYTQEVAWTFALRGSRTTGRLWVARKRRPFLHYYLYFIDPPLGFMHVRLGSWFPFQIQVYVNGREWLARAMDRAGIGYQRYDNTFTRIDQSEAAIALTQDFRHTRWADVLQAVVRPVNPWLTVIKDPNYDTYYWCLDQCEVATDLMFRDRASLERLLGDLYSHAIRVFGAQDVLRFLGRHLARFQGEVSSDLKRRPQGWRIKHRVNRNSIRMYDKDSVLRIETTINNPRDFKVLRTVETEQGTSRRWDRMGKGVANSYRMLEIGTGANQRYLEALALTELKGEAVEILDGLCRSHVKDGKRVAKLRPVAKTDSALFAAVLAGAHLLYGFRNHQLRDLLYPQPAANAKEAKRRGERVSRLIRKLRGHGLVAKVPGARLYRTTPKGYCGMAAALHFRQIDFPAAFNQAAEAA